MTASESEVRRVLAAWAAATRDNRQDEVLRNHSPKVVVFDVLPPLRYDDAASYRRSWEEWQPATEGEVTFQLEDLVVTAGADVAFAHGLVRCGGTLEDGRTFEDVVRATFCLQRVDGSRVDGARVEGARVEGARADGSWQVTHQHLSKPLPPGKP